MITDILLILWWTCGILNYGFTFAYLQGIRDRKEAIKEYKRDREFALIMIVFGFIGLILIILSKSYTRGFKFR